MSRVKGIYIAAEAGAPCEPVERVMALAGVGLEGDRYATGRGELSSKPGTGRHLTLVSREALDDVPLGPGESRRNIETEGVDLDALLGHRFRIGAAECIAVRDCPPCGYLQKQTRDGVVTALQGRGGLRAEILVGGEIAVGDPIEALD